MNTRFSELESKLQSLIEAHLIRYLPGPGMQDRIAQRFTEVIRASLTTKELDSPIDHRFTLSVHPSTLNQWQRDARLMDGLNKIFRLATSEMGLQFKGVPTITLTSDPTLSVDDIKVVMHKEELAETDRVELNAAEETPTGKTAFLIVGGTKVHTINQAVTNIGRRLDNNLVVDDPRVSRYHAQIRFVRGRYIIFDLNSTGGTYVNGQRTTQSVLYPGDVISLAGLPVVFGQDNPPTSMSAGNTTPLSPSSANRKTAVLKTTPPKDDNP